MNIKSCLYFPRDFFGNRTKKDKNVTPCEALMEKIISFHLASEVERGDANKKEPDFKIGEEWVEIRYSEQKAQYHMIKDGSYQSNRTPQLFMDEVRHAIEDKAKKVYSVKNVSVGILSLTDAYLFSFGESDNRFLDCILKQRDDFFESLIADYIDSGVFKNIYIVTIGYNRKFIVFDLMKFKNYELFIHIYGIPEQTNVPYRTLDNIDDN